MLIVRGLVPRTRGDDANQRLGLVRYSLGPGRQGADDQLTRATRKVGKVKDCRLCGVSNAVAPPSLPSGWVRPFVAGPSTYALAKAGLERIEEGETDLEKEGERKDSFHARRLVVDRKSAYLIIGGSEGKRGQELTGLCV